MVLALPDRGKRMEPRRASLDAAGAEMREASERSGSSRNRCRELVGSRRNRSSPRREARSNFRRAG